MHNWYSFTSSLQVKLGFDYGSHHETLSSLLGGFVQHIVWTEIGDVVKKKGVTGLAVENFIRLHKMVVIIRFLLQTFPRV